MITMEKCIENDTNLISKLSNEIWHECYRDMLSYDQRVYMLDKFLNPTSILNQMNSNIDFYFIYYNNELTGYFAIRDDNTHIYLCKLYILEKFRGNGIFTYILNYIDIFKKDIKLNTCKTNPTLKIYLHVGFEITSEAKHDIGNGYFMDDYNLTKKYK